MIFQLIIKHRQVDNISILVLIIYNVKLIFSVTLTEI